MFDSSTRRPDGVVIITDSDGRETHADTKMCVHCGNHFLWVKGSGTQRGFCSLCMGVTCGHANCMEHFAFEKKLDLYEKGKIRSL